jgi:hypothetical protein
MLDAGVKAYAHSARACGGLRHGSDDGMPMPTAVVNVSAMTRSRLIECQHILRV